MEMDMIISLCAMVASVAAVIISVTTYRAGLKRERKQATLDAFNILQSQVLDKLNHHHRSEFEVVAQNCQKEEHKERFNEFRGLIARCEHFAVGVNEEIYDFAVVDKLAAAHFIFLYEKVKPIITVARSRPNAEKYYGEFEHLVSRLRERHPNLTENHTQENI